MGAAVSRREKPAQPQESTVNFTFDKPTEIILSAPGDFEAATCRIYPEPPTPEVGGDELDGGVFELVNVESGTALDLSDEDMKTVVGQTVHRHDRQRWRFTKCGHGYLIENLATKKYLTVDESAVNETQVVATYFPVAWEIEMVNLEKNIIKVLWPNDKLAFDLVTHGKRSTHKSHVRLMWSARDEHCQLWKLFRCPVEDLPRPKSFGNKVPMVDVVIKPDSATGVSSQTTTTITTVTKITKTLKTIPKPKPTIMAAPTPTPPPPPPTTEAVAASDPEKVDGQHSKESTSETKA